MLASKSEGCSFCGSAFNARWEKHKCPQCASTPRLRTLEVLLRGALGGELDALRTSGLPLLAFSAVQREKGLLAPHFAEITSASLYGRYGPDHRNGVDVRSLDGIADSTLAGHYSCLLFDYFVEHRTALNEAFRVLAPGGTFITHILHNRIVGGALPPTTQSVITRAEGYYEYIPSGEHMLNIRVGADWFLAEMEAAGFRAKRYRIGDPTGIVCDWFVGWKDAPETSRPAPALPLDEHKGGLLARIKAFTRKALGSKSPALHLAAAARKEYTVTLPGDFGAQRVRVSLSIPAFEGHAAYSFSEHILKADGTPSDVVVVCGTGGYAISDDLGRSWKHSAPRGLEGVSALHTKLLPGGDILLMTAGANGGGGRRLNELCICDASGKILQRSLATAWHGPRAIDLCGNTLMYAEYPSNTRRGQSAGLVRLPSRVLRSRDFGRTWETVFERSDIRHFHFLQARASTPGEWWLSSGDEPQESRIWKSSDDGDTWVDQTDRFGATLDIGNTRFPRGLFRLTDLVWADDDILWGSDDTLPGTINLEPTGIAPARVSRVFRGNPSTGIPPGLVGSCGAPVRNIVELSNHYLFLTQAGRDSGPGVFLMSKKAPMDCTAIYHLFDIDTYDPGTGFTYSRASRAGVDGVFFTFRGAGDVFQSPTRILRWEVVLE